MNSRILEVAFNQYGVEEIPGKQHNPVILNWFKEIGCEWIKDDETAWCSCFVNWVALKAGVERSGKLNARSWVNVGENIEKPMLGDVVIFWRESRDSWKGHVAFYINDDEDWIYCLGGNQNNKVCVKPYPKYRFLAYRRLKPIVN
jgi:uncharacterized protein (TIGR02594 family)